MESGKLMFNKDRDLYEVDQFGWIDLREAFVTHTVPAGAEIEDADYNGIDDPSTIIGKPRDTFDAINRREGIIASGQAAAQTEGSHGSESGD